MEPCVRIYAEHLPHINTINVHAHIPSASSLEASGFVFHDGRRFLLRCNGLETFLDLPVRTNLKVSKSQIIPARISQDELGFRLQAEDSFSMLHGTRDFEATTPWSAPSLKQLECIHCSNCRSNIVKPWTISTWKDLPSENWAEMMEFWHCHKPDSAALNKDSSSKGYSASSSLVAQSTVGFVDSYTFLCSQQDCISLKAEKSNHTELSSTSLVCVQCAHIIGFVDTKCSGWRLLKSSLAAGIKPHSVFLQQFPLEKWIAAFLLSIVEAQASKKFKLHDPNKQEALLLWIFTPDLRISYTNPNETCSTTRAMKLFWKTQPWTTADEAIPPDQSIEHVDLPMPQYYHALKSHLQGNQSILPASARKHKDWAVSILRRFDDNDVKGPG